MPIFYDVLEKSEKIDLKAGIINAYNGLSTIYIKKKNYTKALHYAQKSLEVSKSMNSVSLNRDIHEQLSIIYAATNDYKNAYQNYKLYKELSDSIDNEENVKKIIELEYTYKFDKEKQAMELEQQKRDIAQAAERKQQQILLFAFFVGFILMFVLFVVIYRSNRNKQKTNIILTLQKREIEEKNEELQQLNEEILAQKDDILAKNADIELKNSKLQELNATKDKFFGIIAHDLKNPFNAILGYSNLLVASLDRLNPEQTKEYISMVHTSAENAYKLLENLLEWSRAQTGGIDFKPKELLLKPLAFETESLCESLASAKDILIHIEISDDAMVYADPNMLNTILRNLITNAIKFTHKGGMITISSVGQNNATTIKVTDTGVGMDEITKNKLFKIHEKVTAPGTEKESGTGLGLLLCKEFVEKHGGTIWVESEVGKGSSFIFTIPAES
jgi:signal transduction histidine kinase